MKALSPAIAVIFLILLVAGLLILVYGFSAGFQQSLTSTVTEVGTSVTGAYARGFIESIDSSNDRIHIRNNSAVTTNIDVFYIDDVRYTCNPILEIKGGSNGIISTGTCGSTFDVNAGMTVLVTGTNSFRITKIA